MRFALVTAAAVKNSSGCCETYQLIYEGIDKHRKNRYPRGGVMVARAPTNGQMTLNTSVPSDGEGDRRVGYDPLALELVIFPLTRTDEQRCIKFYHGWVADYQDDLYGRTNLLNTVRKNSFRCRDRRFGRLIRANRNHQV
jgi:hypothetical protein